MAKLSSTNKLEMNKGDNEKFKIIIVYDDDPTDPVDLTGCKIWFSVKKNYTDTSYELQRRNDLAGGSDSEILITDAVNGECEAYIVPDNTEDMTPSIYVYDVQIDHPQEGIKTPILHKFFLMNEVTTD